MKIRSLIAATVFAIATSQGLAQVEFHRVGEGGMHIGTTRGDGTRLLWLAASGKGVFSITASASGIEGYGADLVAGGVEIRPLGGSSRLRQIPFVFAGRGGGDVPSYTVLGFGLGSAAPVTPEVRVIARTGLSFLESDSISETAVSIDFALQMGNLDGFSVSVGPSILGDFDHTDVYLSIGAVLNRRKP